MEGETSMGAVAPVKKYDVFLSCRGRNTRDFIDFLYNIMKRVGIYVYLDDYEVADDKLPFDVIDNSKICMLIFSSDVAETTSSYMYLVSHMFEKRSWIVPVFYRVKPDAVYNWWGESLQKAFSNSEGQHVLEDEQSSYEFIMRLVVKHLLLLKPSLVLQHMLLLKQPKTFTDEGGVFKSEEDSIVEQLFSAVSKTVEQAFIGMEVLAAGYGEGALRSEQGGLSSEQFSNAVAKTAEGDFYTGGDYDEEGVVYNSGGDYDEARVVYYSGEEFYTVDCEGVVYVAECDGGVYTYDGVLGGGAEGVEEDTEGEKEEEVADQQPNTVYLIYSDGEYYSRGVGYTIHALDLGKATADSQGNHPLPWPEPILCLPKDKFPREMGFAEMDSKLYILGGGACNLDVYVIETSDLVHAIPGDDNCKYVKKWPTKLNARKMDPIIIPLGGKLYVLARSLTPRAPDTEHPLIEVLDPEQRDKEWHKVDLPPQLDQRCSYNIEAYGTSGGFKIILSMVCYQICGERGYYILHTEGRECRWELVVDVSSGFPDINSCIGGKWVLLDGGLWVSAETTDGYLFFCDKHSIRKGVVPTREYIGQSRIMEIGGGSTRKLVSLSWINEEEEETPPFSSAFISSRVHFMVDVLGLVDGKKKKQQQLVSCRKLKGINYEKSGLELDRDFPDEGFVHYSFLARV